MGNDVVVEAVAARAPLKTVIEFLLIVFSTVQAHGHKCVKDKKETR